MTRRCVANGIVRNTASKVTREQQLDEDIGLALAKGRRARHGVLCRLAVDARLGGGPLIFPVRESGEAILDRVGSEIKLASVDRHERARLAWASAHGLVSLEIAGRFLPTATPADLDAAWRRLVRVLSG